MKHAVQSPFLGGFDFQHTVYVSMLQAIATVMKKNDLILGGMTLVLMGTVGATAYYGFQNSRNAIARTTAESELVEAQKTLESKQTAYTKMSDTNSRLNSELNETKNALDETAIKLQKMEQMLARGKSGDGNDPDKTPAESDPVNMEIAQRNLRDLQRRNDELESFATSIRDQLKASSNDEALSTFEQLVQKSGLTDSVAAKVADVQPLKDNTDGKQLKRTLVRVRNSDQSDAASRAAKESNVANNNPTNADAEDSGLVDLSSPKNATETSSREERGSTDVVETDDLVKVTKRPSRNVDARKPNTNDANLSETDLLKQAVTELQEKLDRRERLLREQAELIDNIKPAKSSVSHRETGVRVEREEVIMDTADVSFNEAFSSGEIRSETRRVYSDPAEFRADETVIETIILP